MTSQGSRLGKLRFGWMAGSVQTTLLCGIAFSSALWSPQVAAVKNVPEVKKLPTIQVTVDLPPTTGVTSTQNSEGVHDNSGVPDTGVAGDTGPSDGNGGAPLTQNNNKSPTNKEPRDRSGCSNFGARPIVLNSGTKVETYPVFALPGEMGLSLVLYYNSALKIPQSQSNPYWSTNLQYTLSTGQHRRA